MLFLILGKSGVGKTRIARYFPELVAFTTRAKRENEIDGVDYYFKDKEIIEKIINNPNELHEDEILEYGTYGNHYYGTLRSEFEKKLAKNELVVNVSEIEGALILRKKFPNLVRLIWISADEDIRRKRLQDRSIETKETIEELENRTQENHRDKEEMLCDFTVTNNSDIEKVVNAIKKYYDKLKNENKKEALNSLYQLRQLIPYKEMTFKYFELLISIDFYNNDSSFKKEKLQTDIDFLYNLKSLNSAYEETVEYLDVLIDYLESIIVLDKI